MSAVLSRHRWILEFFIYSDDSQPEYEGIEQCWMEVGEREAQS